MALRTNTNGYKSRDISMCETIVIPVLQVAGDVDGERCNGLVTEEVLSKSYM